MLGVNVAVGVMVAVGVNVKVGVGVSVSVGVSVGAAGANGPRFSAIAPSSRSIGGIESVQRTSGSSQIMSRSCGR